MSTTDDLRLAHYVKKLMDVIFGLLIWAGVLLVIWIVVTPLFLGKNGAQATASIAVGIGSGPEPQFDVQLKGPTQDEIRAAFVDEAQGVLRLETTSWVLISISNAAKVITAAGLAYIFYLLRAVLRAIEEGTPFGEEACVHMRRMGYMVLLVGVLRPTVDYLAAELILKRLPTLEPAISLPSPFQAEVILASALILILAQLWSYGLELERDRALTV